jgi:hypothetical protein
VLDGLRAVGAPQVLDLVADRAPHLASAATFPARFELAVRVAACRSQRRSAGLALAVGEISPSADQVGEEGLAEPRNHGK